MSKEDRPQQKNKSLRSTLESDKHVCLSCKKDDQQLLNIGENMNLNGECGQKVNKSNDQHEFNDGEHKSNDGKHKSNDDKHKSNDDLLLMKRYDLLNISIFRNGDSTDNGEQVPTFIQTLAERLRMFERQLEKSSNQTFV